MIWAIIIVVIIAIDQLSKQFVMSQIPYGEFVTVIDKFFYLTYHENKGAAWGILQGGRIFFLVLTLLISIVMIVMILKSKDKMLKLSLAIILGGALGNFIDRAIKGAVGDFIDFYIFSYHFPTFNAADIFVVIGTILLAVYLLFIYKEPESTKVKASKKSETVAEEDEETAGEGIVEEIAEKEEKKKK